ncbi:Transcription repressor OFP5 [Striga hermonthica]|uniref:Transcription repressor n=1 Tax=Striga hermonthica TaxID=68872 RepID=A0A9N7MSQ0_STRHE|nr:Transcription repressor OFP5 [Striga hermonthica]
MYCGVKKYPPSSHASIINSVFPGSWFSKFKPRPTSPEPNPTRAQNRAKPDFPAQPSFPREARFYSVDGDDDDAYWRLSFHDEHAKGITGIPPSPSSSGEEARIPVFPSFGPKLGRRPRNSGRRRPDEPVEKVIFPVEEEGKIIRKKKGFQDSPADDSDGFGFSPSPVEEDYDFSDETSDDESEPRTMRSRQRRITKQKNRALKANGGYNYSPKWDLEDLKRVKIRPRKKEIMKGGGTMYDSFAEVKTSYNPGEDFRQSMVEMICEQGIKRPEELEELLACYLTLNSDEHHGLIIRVFQEVWFELSGAVC